MQPTRITTAASESARRAANLDGVDSIHRIHLPAGVDAIHYDFCEHVGVMLSGNVYHDRNNDGIFDRGTKKASAVLW